MSDHAVKKYKPSGYKIISFGVLHEHSCYITLHPNSRWYAERENENLWRVTSAKTVIYLTHSEFRRTFILV